MYIFPDEIILWFIKGIFFFSFFPVKGIFFTVFVTTGCNIAQIVDFLFGSCGILTM